MFGKETGGSMVMIREVGSSGIADTSWGAGNLQLMLFRLVGGRHLVLATSVVSRAIQNIERRRHVQSGLTFAQSNVRHCCNGPMIHLSNT